MLRSGPPAPDGQLPERDVDYDVLLGDSTQTDNDRRAKQVGIGLVSGPTTFGH